MPRPPLEVDAEGWRLHVLGSLDGHELGASGGTDTDLTVTNGFVGHGVLTEVVTDHIGLDLNGVPILARVDFADGADHLGHDDGVAEVGLDGLGLLTVGGLLHGLGELLDQTVVAGLDTTAESSALTGAEHVDDVLGVHSEELLQLNTSVNLLSECFFGFLALLGLGGGKPFSDSRHI